MTITEERPTSTIGPGVYDDMPSAEYHANPALSASGAKRLMATCPAKFRYEQDHARPNRKTWDIGHAAHRLVLGIGQEIVLCDFDNWRTKAAQGARDEAYAADAVPLLPDEYQQVHDMAEALREHPVAGALFDPEHGRGEVSMFWRDAETGVNRRARFDWLDTEREGRLLIPDYKTCADATEDALSKAVNQFGYHQQAGWYLDAAEALELGPQPSFLFVFQEKTAPYLIVVKELDLLSLRIGRELNRTAIDTFKTCTETGVWPGYSDAVDILTLPAWVENQYLRGI